MVEEDAAALAESIRQGDRRALARAITLIESTRPDHRSTAIELLEVLLPYTGDSARIGISGAPGVGKSTFIEALGNHVIAAGHRIAILAVDPSSAISGGSILGDKTRMETLSRREEAYIRPSPAGSTLGGVTRRSRETLLLCEAAGFDVIVVETVGVGQSETRVADMTDMFVLLLQPGGGDQLQGIKRGIMELADLVLVNKSDGALESLAAQAAAEYRDALHLLQSRTSDWTVEVQTCSAIENTGVTEAWETMLRYAEALSSGNLRDARRAEQALIWMWSDVHDSLLADLKSDTGIQKLIPDLEAAVSTGEITASKAAQSLLELHRKRGVQ